MLLDSVKVFLKDGSTAKLWLSALGVGEYLVPFNYVMLCPWTSLCSEIRTWIIRGIMLS